MRAPLPPPTAASTSSLPFWLALWLSFWALWTLSTVVQAGGELVPSAIASAYSMGFAALLGAAVWRRSGQRVWPERAKLRDYFEQAALASSYSFLWVLFGYVRAAVQHGENFVQMVTGSQLLGWQLIMGLWLYGSVAGASHTLRARARARDREQAAARAEHLAVTAQLHALRAQLQPHFLFNALHAVSALVRSSPRAAEDAIERLGELLRYALDSHGSDEVPFRQEWHFTRQYLALEKLRLGERLTVTSHLPPDLVEIKVPSFVLQPLVENAIVHGIAAKTAPSTLHVELTGDERSIRIVVRDDGIGCTPSDLQRSGSGLATLRQRLHALYGDAATVEVGALVGSGCTAVVTLPRRESDTPVPS